MLDACGAYSSLRVLRRGGYRSATKETLATEGTQECRDKNRSLTYCDKRIFSGEFCDNLAEKLYLCTQEKIISKDMTTRREKAKAQKPQINKQLEAVNAEEPKVKVNQRKEKFADFLIDVAKYVLTGVVITSLFNDVTDKTTIYLIGIAVVCVTLLLGLSLTSKTKDK